MEPIRKDKPSLGLFITMTLVYFGAYFGLKHLVFQGQMPGLLNLGLILVCIAAVLGLKKVVDARNGKKN